MKNFKLYILSIFLLSIFLFACKKEGDNIFNMFDVTVDFHSDNQYSVTDYKEVMDGDSVYIDFTLKSPNKDMYTACLLEVGTSTPLLKLKIDDSGRREFSYTIKLKADKKIGMTTYRVYPLDKRGIYLGDGYKTVAINVKSNFSYFTERQVALPYVFASFPQTATDSIKAIKSFLSLTTGEVFSYAEGAANSAKIDLGIYANIPAIVPPATSVQPQYMLYSLSATTNPVNYYDISTWTKRETLFSAPIAKGKAALDALKTGAQIEAAAKKVAITQKGPITVVGDNIIYFKTPEGKYGALCFVGLEARQELGKYSNLYFNTYVKILD